MNIKIERQWRASTGYSKEQFYTLLDLFEKSYLKIKGKSMNDLREGVVDKFKIKSYEDLLFFTLFGLKSGLNYDLLGLFADMDNSNAKRNFEIGITILKDCLEMGEFAPKREFKKVKEFEAYFEGEKELIIDGTEQKIQRPKKEQEEFYSGKKNVIL